MIFDPAVDTEEEVLAIRTRAKELLTEGATTISWNSEGTSVNKTITMPIKQVMEETLLFLRKVDPDTYGKSIKRTVPRYTS